MPLRSRSSKKWQRLNLPLSYRSNESRPRLQEGTRNVFDNQGRIDTRYGKSRYNSTSLGGSVLSTSFFRDNDGNSFLIAKVGAVIYSVQESGAHTSIKTGLTATTKHRGITLNNRHIISVEGDGLFQFDGTTFTALGQAAPTGWSAALVNNQGSLSNGAWRVALTYYSSVTGFETNATYSSTVNTSSPNSRIAITNIDDTPTNATLDKMRIYASLGTADFTLVEEVDIAATYNVDTDPSSIIVPPTKNAPPIAGGGKYMTEFMEMLVYSGNNSFKNDVFFSEPNIADAFDNTGESEPGTLFMSGDGEITGLATGFFNDSNLDPFLVIFKRTSINIYSEVGGNARLATIENGIGCVSHNTIVVRNGIVYFLSDSGWRAIQNGLLVRGENNEVTLGFGDIDDIFKREGFDYEVTRSQIENAFSCYYPDLDQYFTFLADAQSDNVRKSYIFNYLTPGFYLYEFEETITSCARGQDQDGNNLIFLSDNSGYIYTHSIAELRNDQGAGGVIAAIDARARIVWTDGEDFSASYNFRDLFVRALNSDNPVDVYAYVNYSYDNSSNYELDFSVSGFRLDIDRLDFGVLGDERQVATSKADINRVGENLAIEFRQKVSEGNLGLFSMQLDFSKNGNRN